MSRTILQQTNFAGFPKAGELIEITGAHALEAADRAVINLLLKHAHDSGKLADDTEWEIPLARLRPSTHESNDRLRQSLKRILNVQVTVPYRDPRAGEPRVLVTTLFAFFDVSAAEAAPDATLRYGIQPKLRPILAGSNHWGRIQAEVVCAMSSKYAIALYELVQLRANLDRCVETFPLDRFRDLLGVPPGKLAAGRNLMQKAIAPALLEVNGLSDMTVRIEPVRRSARAPMDGVTVQWGRKQGDAFRDALRELNRSKIGRLARLRGQVETAVPAP